MKNTNLNDRLLPVTPSMTRFTIQANAYAAAIDLLPRSYIPVDRLTTGAAFVVFVNEWMRGNAHDEIGNYVDMVEFACSLEARRAV